jgi:hypothetical protein
MGSRGDGRRQRAKNEGRRRETQRKKRRDIKSREENGAGLIYFFNQPIAWNFGGVQLTV